MGGTRERRDKKGDYMEQLRRKEQTRGEESSWTCNRVCMASLHVEVLGLNLFTGGRKSGHVCKAHGRAEE